MKAVKTLSLSTISTIWDLALSLSLEELGYGEAPSLQYLCCDELLGALKAAGRKIVGV